MSEVGLLPTSVQNLESKNKSEVQNLSLKPKTGGSKKSKTEVQTLKSEVCLKSAQSLAEVVYVKFEVQNSQFVRNQKSVEVRSKSVQSLNSEICPKPEVLCPKSVRSLTSEDRILKSKIATKIQNS